MNNNEFQCSFSIDASNWLKVSLRVSLFGYTVKSAFALNDWKMYHKAKSWFVFVHVGPVYFKIVDENKLTDYINKVLQENEDRLHSES